MNYREPLYKLTADGGVTICRGNEVRVAMEILAIPDTRLRYVRRGDATNIVMIVDITRNTWSATHHGTPINDADIQSWCPWMPLLWRLITSLKSPTQPNEGAIDGNESEVSSPSTT